MSSRILIIGGAGMLGSDVVIEATRRGHQVTAPTSQELDITDPLAVGELAMEPGKFDWCINCAAYTAVDLAETNQQAAYELNALAPGYLSNACSMAGIKVIHISTDFVFDGNSDVPYSEEDPTHPLGVYGLTKRDGELAVFGGNTNAIVVRTSWLYGLHGKCFPKTMISAWQSGRKLKVVADQTGCPTSTVDLARVLIDLVDRNAFPGIYHATCPDETTWHAFAVAAVEAWKQKTGSDVETDIASIPTADYPTPAKRPHYSVLSNDKLRSLGIAPMRPLAEALQTYVDQFNLTV